MQVEMTFSSSIWGKAAGNGKPVEQMSPIDGVCFHNARMVDAAEMEGLLASLSSVSALAEDQLDLFCTHLHEELEALKPEIIKATRLETAFSVSDSDELVESSLDYLKGFPDYFRNLQKPKNDSLTHFHGHQKRQIDLVDVPYGTVAAILPQSAFLYLAVTCLLNALASGNRVIVRSPAQSACSAGLLSAALVKMGSLAEAVSVVLASSRSFVDAIYSSKEPIILHYLGSSSHAPDIMSKCFEAGKSAIIDGEGNAWAYVDSDVPVDLACEILTEGALRYNGETCTSINGAIIHPSIYDKVESQLIERWKSIKYGVTTDPQVQVGPVLDESQAEWILDIISESGARIAAGGTRKGNLLAPTLAVGPSKTSKLATEGIFGPALWITEGDFNDFRSMWTLNRFPLCASVLTNCADTQSRAIRLPGAARVVLNGDPSVEYIYEPWGGYPATGNNPVSHWYRKYMRVVQVDRTI